MHKTIRNSSSPRRQVVIAIVCSILFLGFSFAYLYGMQGELMRCLYYNVFGVDTYSPFWGAFAITLALWGGRWLLDRVLHFGSIGLAFSYFPAYWALAFLTCVFPFETGETTSLGWSSWWWLFPLALIVYLFIGFVYRYRRVAGTARKSLVEALIPNLIILILYSLVTGSVGNCNELLHNKLLVAQCIREQRYEEALLVGKKSLHNTHSLTTLRALALSYTGKLGESLFEYPQSIKSNGLFFPKGKVDVCRFTDEDIELRLGGISREKDESVVNYLSRMCESDSTVDSPALDYYLCALLLERELPRFHQTLLTYWPLDKTLPRHYQEALLVYLQLTGEISPLASLCTPSVKERYDGFCQLQAEYELPLHQNNYTRRKYGDTYWWYYCYGGQLGE